VRYVDWMKELQIWVRGSKESEGFVAIVEERQKQCAPGPDCRLLVGRPSLPTRSMSKQIRPPDCQFSLWK
jgi:hypothetical protein